MKLGIVYERLNGGGIEGFTLNIRARYLYNKKTPNKSRMQRLKEIIGDKTIRILDVVNIPK